MTEGDSPQSSAPPRELISVTEIRRHLGSRLAVRRSIEPIGLALSDVRVAEGVAVELTGEAESISDGVVLTGAITVAWEGSCRRCLEPTNGTAVVDVREIYETHPVDGETWPLEQDHIDVGPLLRDTALLALPLAPLCLDDCPGPAPEAYPTNAVPEPPRDPRWAALDDLDLG